MFRTRLQSVRKGLKTEHLITLQEATERYLIALSEVGKSPRTLYTYGKDCKQMLSFFWTR